MAEEEGQDITFTEDATQDLEIWDWVIVAQSIVAPQLKARGAWPPALAPSPALRDRLSLVAPACPLKKMLLSSPK